MGELVGGEGSGADGWMDGRIGRWVCGWYVGWMDRGVGGGLRGLMGVWIVVRVGGWNHLIHHFSSNQNLQASTRSPEHQPRSHSPLLARSVDKLSLP